MRLGFVLRKAQQLDLLAVAERTPEKPKPGAIPADKVRHYFRCKKCLSTWASDFPKPAPASSRHGAAWGSLRASPVQRQDLDVERDAAHAPCPYCKAVGVDHMGRVHEDRLVTEAFKVPCDARCTNARGPSCDCKCGGANHGSQMLVAVERDAGSVRFAASAAQVAQDAGKREAQSKELEEATEAVNARLGWYKDLAERRQKGEWLSEPEFAELAAGWRFNHAKQHARSLKMHPARIKALHSLADRIDAYLSEEAQ